MKKLSSIKAKISLVMILFITAAVIIAILVNYKSLTGMAHDTLTDYISDSLLEIVKAHGSGIDESIEKYNSTMKYLDITTEEKVKALATPGQFDRVNRRGLLCRQAVRQIYYGKQPARAEQYLL